MTPHHGPTLQGYVSSPHHGPTLQGYDLSPHHGPTLQGYDLSPHNGPTLQGCYEQGLYLRTINILSCGDPPPGDTSNPSGSCVSNWSTCQRLHNRQVWLQFSCAPQKLLYEYYINKT